VVSSGKAVFVRQYFQKSMWLRHGLGLALVASASAVVAQTGPQADDPGNSITQVVVPVLTMESLAPHAAPQLPVAVADTVPAPADPSATAPRGATQPQSRRLASSDVRRISFGQQEGLHDTRDALALKSSVALVLDQDTSEVLFSKNTQAVLPIASLTKLMTALVVVEAGLPLDETLEITDADVDTEKFSRSHLKVGTRLTRGEMLHLALMSSENRAAHALGRHYPGGLDAFVEAMNRKAQSLGMKDTGYVEPTGLSSRNQSTAPDLARLVNAASGHALIRELSTSPESRFAVGRRTLQFRNTNGLVRSKSWDIGLQKTGYIVEAGRCLVMQASLAGRKLIMVFLDSTGKYSRIGDAERVRHWIEHDGQLPAAAAATSLSSGARKAASPVGRSARKKHAPHT
jgi:D-alanyl-D-alanine endopeptidase (penicillin-binding protein 7)